MVSKSTLVLAVLATPIVLALPGACTSDGTSSFGDGDGTRASGGAGVGSGTGGGIDLSVGSGGGGGETPCLAEEAQADPIVLDMILVVDRSGSMINFSYWAPTVNALKAFFDDPQSAGVNVGLNLFPNPQQGNDCNPANWNPPFVPNPLPLAELPTDSAVLKSALDNNTAVSGQLTPMYGALDGSYQFALSQQQANPTHKVIVALAGDGNPEGGFCRTQYGTATTETIAGSVALAQQNFDDNGIETYTISISGSVLSAMNQIAAAGGTVQAYDVSTNINAFTAKMQEIRDAALGCEYAIPEDGGEAFDPLKVNVNYTPGGGTSETIPQADNAEDCGNLEGWYYDDPIDPTKIILCPATCMRVQTDPGANIRLAFGCPTTLN